MRVKVGSVALLKAAASGYGIGLDGDGHLIEFVGDWRELATMRTGLDGGDPIYADLEDWQVIAVDDEVRLPLRPEGLAERAAFVRSALATLED